MADDGFSLSRLSILRAFPAVCVFVTAISFLLEGVASPWSEAARSIGRHSHFRWFLSRRQASNASPQALIPQPHQDAVRCIASCLRRATFKAAATRKLGFVPQHTLLDFARH